MNEWMNEWTNEWIKAVSWNLKPASASVLETVRGGGGGGGGGGGASGYETPL